MDKMQMAHDYAMKCVGNPNSALNTNNQIVSFAWQYADAMQAEADKRNKAEAEQKQKEMREMLNATNTFVEREGQHFDDIEEAKREGEYFFKLFCRQNGIDDSKPLCEVDWSQAPDDAVAWVYSNVDKSGFWCHKKPIRLSRGWCTSTMLKKAPSFNYQGDWKDSLRKRPQ